MDREFEALAGRAALEVTVGEDRIGQEYWKESWGNYFLGAAKIAIGSVRVAFFFLPPLLAWAGSFDIFGVSDAHFGAFFFISGPRAPENAARC